jgi:hypothetical protein
MEKMVRQIALYLASGYPMVNLVTSEEQRAMKDVFAAIRKVGKNAIVWSATADAQKFAPNDEKRAEILPDTKVLDGMLAYWLNPENRITNTVLVLLDLGSYKNYLLNEPSLNRGLRDAIANAPTMDAQKAEQGCNVIHVGPEFPMYPAIEKMVQTMTYDLPTSDDYREIVAENAKANDLAIPESDDQIVRACAGLTWDEANNAVCLSVVETGEFNPRIIKREKVQVIKQTGFLSLLPAEPGGIDVVGGLDLLKADLQEVFSGDSADMEEFGCDPRKGILLVGPPGTGKSLVMKVISAINRNESILADVPGMQDSLIGNTEKNTRKATSLCSAVAPVNVCFDEIDKALAGSQSQNAGDSGVGRKQFGHLLSWMQEQKGCFLVLTANSIAGIDAAMFRAGRIDKIWAVDYPAPPERIEILNIHFAKRKRNLADIFTTDKHRDDFIAATEDYSGAEIEQICKNSILRAFADGKRKVTAEDVISAAKRMVPLSQTAKDEVRAMRDWCKQNAEPASSYRADGYKTVAPKSGGRKLQTY